MPRQAKDGAFRLAEASPIAIVLCTYNNADSLSRALESLARQDDPLLARTEVVVVDNNCTDHTRDVVDQHRSGGKLPGLALVSETRQGLTHARKRGVMATNAPFIAFVDDDCLLAPDWLRQAIAFTHARPAMGVFGSRVTLRWEAAPKPLHQRLARWYAEQDWGPVPRRVTTRSLNLIVGAGMVARRDALLASGWLGRHRLADRTGATLSSGGDIEMVIRVRQAGFEAWYAPDCRVTHVIPASRMGRVYMERLFHGMGMATPPLARLAWRNRGLAGANVAYLWLKSWARALGRRRHGDDAATFAAIQRAYRRGLWAGVRQRQIGDGAAASPSR